MRPIDAGVTALHISLHWVLVDDVGARASGVHARAFGGGTNTPIHAALCNIVAFLGDEHKVHVQKMGEKNGAARRHQCHGQHHGWHKVWVREPPRDVRRTC